MGELGLEDLAVLGRSEVSAPHAPLVDASDDAADQLLDARLALGGSQVTPEVLRDYHVGGELRPAPRDLAVALLEDQLAALVRDRGRAELPLTSSKGCTPARSDATETGGSAARPPARALRPARPARCCLRAHCGPRRSPHSRLQGREIAKSSLRSCSIHAVAKLLYPRRCEVALPTPGSEGARRSRPSETREFGDERGPGETPGPPEPGQVLPPTSSPLRQPPVNEPQAEGIVPVEGL
jgi:hypothetical protein